MATVSHASKRRPPSPLLLPSPTSHHTLQGYIINGAAMGADAFATPLNNPSDHPSNRRNQAGGGGGFSSMFGGGGGGEEGGRPAGGEDAGGSGEEREGRCMWGGGEGGGSTLDTAYRIR